MNEHQQALFRGESLEGQDRTLATGITVAPLGQCWMSVPQCDQSAVSVQQ